MYFHVVHVHTYMNILLASKYSKEIYILPSLTYAICRLNIYSLHCTICGLSSPVLTSWKVGVSWPRPKPGCSHGACPAARSLARALTAPDPRVLSPSHQPVQIGRGRGREEGGKEWEEGESDKKRRKKSMRGRRREEWRERCRYGNGVTGAWTTHMLYCFKSLQIGTLLTEIHVVYKIKFLISTYNYVYHNIKFYSNLHFT